MISTKDSFSSIDFPINIVRFGGMIETANPNVNWISSRIRKMDFPEGITVCVKNSHSSSTKDFGYSKWFEMYFTQRRENPHRPNWTYIWSKFIIRSYRSMDHDNKNCHWRFNFYGSCPEDSFEKILVAKDAMLQYMENFKT